MSVNNIKGVLFDMDGTLLDTAEGVFNSLVYAIKRLGLSELSEAEMCTFIGPPLQDSFVRVYGMSKDEAQNACNVYREYYRSKGVFEAKPYDGIKELCLALKAKGIKTGVATYKVEEFALQVLEHFGIAECFDVVHGSQSVNNTRTKADIIALCADELNVAKNEEVLLIGDSFYDAVGARDAGVGFIGVTYGFGFKTVDDVKEYNPVFVCDSVAELSGFFGF